MSYRLDKTTTVSATRLGDDQLTPDQIVDLSNALKKHNAKRTLEAERSKTISKNLPPPDASALRAVSLASIQTSSLNSGQSATLLAEIVEFKPEGYELVGRDIVSAQEIPRFILKKLPDDIRVKLEEFRNSCPDVIKVIELLFSNYKAIDYKLFNEIYTEKSYFSSACLKSVIDLMNINDESEDVQKNRILQAVFLASLINDDKVSNKAFSEICKKTGCKIASDTGFGVGFKFGLANLDDNINYTCGNWTDIFGFRNKNPNHIKMTMPEILSTPTLPNLNIKINILPEIRFKNKGKNVPSKEEMLRQIPKDSIFYVVAYKYPDLAKCFFTNYSADDYQKLKDFDANKLGQTYYDLRKRTYSYDMKRCLKFLYAVSEHCDSTNIAEVKNIIQKDLKYNYHVILKNGIFKNKLCTGKIFPYMDYKYLNKNVTGYHIGLPEWSLFKFNSIDIEDDECDCRIITQGCTLIKPVEFNGFDNFSLKPKPSSISSDLLSYAPSEIYSKNCLQLPDKIKFNHSDQIKTFLEDFTSEDYAQLRDLINLENKTDLLGSLVKIVNKSNAKFQANKDRKTRMRELGEMKLCVFIAYGLGDSGTYKALREIYNRCNRRMPGSYKESTIMDEIKIKSTENISFSDKDVKAIYENANKKVKYK